MKDRSGSGALLLSRLLLLGRLFPHDVAALVLRHACSTTISDGWRRFVRSKVRTRYARTDSWRGLRAHLVRHLGGEGVDLCLHDQVRREWAREPESWLMASGEELSQIRDECKAGMWG